MAHQALRETSRNLRLAVHQSNAASKEGILERLFTFAFKGLVYPQIWEDPELDMEALCLTPESRLLSISSGGCNVMSYLTAHPKEIVAVDLNRAHIALLHLKLAAARKLNTHEDFFRFFGTANSKGTKAIYDRDLKPNLPAGVRDYWEGRGLTGRRRITLFQRNFYHHGLLGFFISAAHLLARLHGTNPRELLNARSLQDQRAFFENELAPLFERPFIKWLTSKKTSLYGLGIPPAQYDALVGGPDGSMADVLKERLEKLCCDFPLRKNYFAQQAFGRCYSTAADASLPLYLQTSEFETIRQNARRVSVHHRSLTDQMAHEPDGSLHAFILLDAQDWMDNDQLNALWSEITRTAAPGARVVFRTAGEETILPGRVDDHLLSHWSYKALQSREMTMRDRSAIYGGVHVYVKDA